MQKPKFIQSTEKEIYICAKNGGVDPDGNLALRRLIERAKKDQVPTHVIERAIDKAKGGGGEDYVATRYEGYGPGNCMIIVDCLTDNNKRTFADVRVVLLKRMQKLVHKTQYHTYLITSLFLYSMATMMKPY